MWNSEGDGCVSGCVLVWHDVTGVVVFSFDSRMYRQTLRTGGHAPRSVGLSAVCLLSDL